MKADLADLNAFLAVAQARGFRDAARVAGSSASTLSEAVRRLEARLSVRLLHRTTRSVVPTEAGTRLLERLAPALGEVEAALDVVNLFRDRPAGIGKAQYCCFLTWICQAIWIVLPMLGTSPHNGP